MPKAMEAKTRMIRLLKSQPPDATYDELLRELAMHRIVDQGLEDIRQGRTIPHQEMKKRVKSWRK